MQKKTSPDTTAIKIKKKNFCKNYLQLCIHLDTEKKKVLQMRFYDVNQLHIACKLSCLLVVSQCLALSDDFSKALSKCMTPL